MSLLNYYLDTYSIRSPRWIDDQHIVYSYDKTGVAQLWKQNIETNEVTQLTDYENFVGTVISHPDTGMTAFTMSEEGNEKFQIFTVDNNEKVRNLSQNNEATFQIGSFSKDGKTLFYSSNERQEANFDLYLYNFENNEKILLLENNDNYNFPGTISSDNRYYLYTKLLAENNESIWIYDKETNESYIISDKVAKYSNPIWDSSGEGFYFTTNESSDFTYVAFYKLSDKSISKVKDFHWDVETISLNFNSSLLSCVINENGRSRVTVLDTTDFNEVSLPDIPDGEIAFYDQLSWAPSEDVFIFTLSNGTMPPNVWVLDITKNTIKQLTANNLNKEIQDLTVNPELKSYESFDGLKVPYWLYVPVNETGKNMPLVIEIHGGPEAQERTNFDGMIQYFLSQGIAVAAPNVRGSTGYGVKYSHLDDVEKRLDSVKDIEYLVKDLVDSGVANKDKIAVSGTSYGGFMTLSCAARYPDLFCAAIDNVGMYNLVTFLENTASYRRKHRESEYGSLEKHRDILLNVSPVAKVDNIQGPLMVIHGANDPRVPVSEAEQVVDYLQEKGVEVEYLRYEDEGHGLHKYVNKLDCYQKMIDFLKKNMKSEEN